jgi:hypothetical protein
MDNLSTFFDKNYLSRGLVLYNSLKKHSNNFEFYILCLDDFTYNYFNSNKLNYPEIISIQLSDIEEEHEELLNVKKNRSTIEYYFTLSPILPLYLLKKYNLLHICTLDADILFLNSPEKIFNKLNEYSIIITPHKFSNENIDKQRYGVYNVSFQIFKNNKIGLKCLEYWKSQCLEYCSDKLDIINNRFADQKYLDNWNELYPNEVFSLNDNTSGLAPWNLDNYNLKVENNQFYSNEEKIIFYHFHQFKIFNKKWASNGFDEYKVKRQIAIDDLYLYYWNKIDFYNNQITNNEVISIRYLQSKNIISKLLKEKIVYKKINEFRIKRISFRTIPKFIRKLIIKIYG